jgi:hypothetical protein
LLGRVNTSRRIGYAEEEFVHILLEILHRAQRAIACSNDRFDERDNNFRSLFQRNESIR